MEPNIISYFKEYNRIIDRINTGDAYFQQNPEKVNLYISEFQKLIFDRQELEDKIERNGYSMTAEERLNGFRQIRFLDLSNV